MSGEGTITIELCASETAELVKLLNARLTGQALSPDEKTILGSLATKFLAAVLPMALQEIHEEQDRLN